MKTTTVLTALAVGAALFVAPGLAQNPPAAPPPSPPAVVTHDPFGEQVTFPERTVLFRKGEASWDDGWPKLVEMFKELKAAAERLGLKVTGPALVIYRGTDDDGFKYEGALPIEGTPSSPLPEGLAIGPGPSGGAAKFVHRGPFDTLDTSYESIINYLDSQKIEAEDLSVEEYVTDPVTTKPEDLVVNIYMPLKKKKP
jgi:effector-binding domain-containing protein